MIVYIYKTIAPGVTHKTFFYIYIGTSGGAKPVQTGFDILDAQRILEKGVEISRIRIGGKFRISPSPSISSY